MEGIRNTQGQRIEKKIIKQVSKMKIIIRTLAVIMVVAGLFLTLKVPEFIHGLSYTELGSLANGYPIEDVDAMLKFMGVSSEKDLGEFSISNNKSNAQEAINKCIGLTCVYWFIASMMLFIPIKDEETEVNVLVKGN